MHLQSRRQKGRVCGRRQCRSVDRLQLAFVQLSYLIDLIDLIAPICSAGPELLTPAQLRLAIVPLVDLTSDLSSDLSTDLYAAPTNGS